MPWVLYSQGKSTQYLLDRRLGGPQSCIGHSGEEKNNQPLLEIECTSRFPSLYPFY